MADSVDATQFTRVDDTRDTSFFVQFLDAARASRGNARLRSSR
jgi:hypothetical protein